MNVSARLARNSVIAWLSSLTGAAGGFILVAYLVEHLGITDYGIVELLDALIVFTMLSDLGIRGALGRHLTEHIARGDSRRMNELLTLSAACYIGIAAALFVLCWAFAGVFVAALKITGPDKTAAVWLVRLFVPAYTLTMFVGTSFTAVIESHHRFDLVDLVHAGEIVLRLLFIFLAISLAGWGLEGWAAGYLLAKLISTLIYAACAWRLSPAISLRPRHLTWSVSSELFSLGGMMLLYQAVLKLSAQTDPFILSGFLGPAAVALYRPAFRVIMAASPFVAVVNRQLRPLATNYFVRGQTSLIQELLVRGTKVSLLLSLPFAVIFICFAHPLIDLWLGNARFGVTARVLVLWTLADLAANAAGAQFQVLLGMNRIRLIVAIQTVGALANVAASVVLIGLLVWLDCGANVCVPAVVLPTIVTAWLCRTIITVHVARETGLRTTAYLLQGFVPPAVVAAILLALGFVLQATFRLDTWPRLLAACAAVGAAWLAITWFWGMDATDRRRLLNLASGRR